MASIGKLLFDGPLGRVGAAVMARANRDAEAEAVRELAPRPEHDVLVIGVGPGVGVQLIAEWVPRGHVVGIDPSRAMLRAATKRNQRAVDMGQVLLHQGVASELPYGDAAFHGVVTVNTIQLWDPFEASLAEVARVLRPGGRLVSFTHDWAIKRTASTHVEDWAHRTAGLCRAHGLRDARHWRGAAEGGRSVAFVAERAPA